MKFLTLAKVREGLLDGLVGHGEHPQPLDRLLGLGQFVDIGEDELTLATGVAGIYDHFDVLALELLLELLKLFLGRGDGLELKLRRDDGKVPDFPGLQLLVEVVRHVELDQMSDGAIDDPFVVFKKVFLLGDVAQDAGKVAGDARLFGDD